MSAAVTALDTRRAAARCDHCGHALDAGPVVVEGTVRSVVFTYCGTACRDEHAAAVVATARECYFCPSDAVGDAGLCEVHVDAENAPATLPLAG